MATLFDTITATVTHVTALGDAELTDTDRVAGLDDETVVALAGVLAELGRATQTLAALVAGDVAHRSRQELGHSGLAQRAGFRSPEAFVQATTRSTKAEAVKQVRTGRELVEHDAVSKLVLMPEMPDVEAAWFAPITEAIASGRLSRDQGDQLRKGLGEPTEDVPAAKLTLIVERLVRDGARVDPDRLYRVARTARDEIDAAGVGLRERERQEARYLRMFELSNGMWRLDGLLDPESAATAKAFFDPIMVPRSKAGPRFVSEADTAWAQSIIDDPRSTDQLMADAFVEGLRLAGEVAPDRMLGSRRPGVFILTTSKTVADGEGAGWFEGQSDPVSMDTIERFLCEGVVEVTIDSDGRVLDYGREQRLFTRKQKDAMAVRDGGCMWPECERPPKYTEGHHINEWDRDGGSTDVDDGICLCKFHHLLLHNNDWAICRVGAAEYWLIPPPDVDPEQAAIRLHSKNPAYRELLALQIA